MLNKGDRKQPGLPSSSVLLTPQGEATGWQEMQDVAFL